MTIFKKISVDLKPLNEVELFYTNNWFSFICHNGFESKYYFELESLFAGIIFSEIEAPAPDGLNGSVAEMVK